MNKFTKTLLVLSTAVLLAGVPTAFAVNYKSNYNDLQSQNTELTQVVEDKQLELDNANSLIDGYKNTIDEQQGAIEDYQNQLKGYEGFVNGAEMYYKVNYIVKDEYNSFTFTEFVKHGELAAAAPTSTDNMTINSWHLEDGTQVDLTAYSILDHIDLYADCEILYSYRYSTNGNYGAVYKASALVVPETNPYNPSSYDSSVWTYLGVYSSSEDKIYSPGETYYFKNITDLSTVVVLDNLLTRDVTATFKVDGEEYQVVTESISTENDYMQTRVSLGGKIADPTKDGYTFKGWAVEGAEDTIINLYSRYYIDDVTFVAVFEVDADVSGDGPDDTEFGGTADDILGI